MYIVDDNSISLKIIQKSITKRLDCNVRTFSTAEECIRTIELRTPNLVVADYYLDSDYRKRMNGDDLLRKIKQKHPQVPVIMYSSIDSIKLVVELIKSGAQDFIPRNKNFIPEITKATASQINKKKLNIKIKKIVFKTGFILLLAILCYAFVFNKNSDWLIYTGLLSLIAIVTFSLPKLFSEKNPSNTNNN